ncbi:YjgN family protein [Sphingobium subterraneum]|uniref:Uncharacterized membrane protein YjgN (DUF898 family) n=1 Tax=Sphingobium subterraneum TaxID=627688 RepID=A0A841J2B4_9SPHN|nr:YjgN family protein [Sphingobium subterraneum]MBB6124492.1 uncharacterized membrane protein YjgN (DUF898 family) [Sphingobium subterraneum]
MEEQQHSAFGFDGSWKGYAPIAFTNLLLMIVTLGIYRFWATTRTRRYLWSHSRFIDDRLEWTGTGKELFLGFLMVILILGLPFFILQFGARALVMRGHAGIAGLLGFASFLVIFYFVGIARFRALRYRLGRTYWHGIRGGSDDAGWSYGWSYMWKTIVGMMAIYLLVPRAMMSLWNERWNAMSFGPHAFESKGDYRPAFKRYLMFYLLPLIILGCGIVFAMFVGVGSIMMGGGAPGGSPIGALLGVLFGVGIYGLFLFIGLSFYAIFIREAVGGLSLATLTFAFDASTKDWVKLFLGDIALVIGTLGIGAIFLQYRHWKFFITHLEAYGDIDLDRLTQSDTKLSKHGEGLLDALDVGAF